MAPVMGKKGAVSLKAYAGDAKTLLAFNLEGKPARKQLAGFTLQVTPPTGKPYFAYNNLRFERPGDHSQDPSEPAVSSINAPFHKFRWVHVPGLTHQSLTPAFGTYTYTVTPRYFDDKGSMQPLDTALSVAVDIDVKPFAKGKLALGFTRGFVQSQAFVRRFDLHAPIQPQNHDLIFDTTQPSGKNAQGQRFTYADEYEWLGFTARARIFELLDEVVDNKALSLDVFAYDLDEPDIIQRLLKLAKSKRIRIILDNAALHHNKAEDKDEDKFEALFKKAAGETRSTPASKSRIKRGKFGRYAHDKVFIVYDAADPKKVLTGSTNFSVTGLYVNSNHVLVFDDPVVAKTYASVFQTVWDQDVKAAKFAKSDLANNPTTFGKRSIPKTEITFSPHDEATATSILTGLIARVAKEKRISGRLGSVLFAVMELDGGEKNPVYAALRALHRSQTVFSYGISDATEGIALYPVGKANGVLVTGKPSNTQLPPPFSQVPSVGSGHQVHHKFVVCGFNGPDPVVYCGSSNLALKGEQVNGDNLLVIRDEEVATAFAIEALALVDHFNFLDSVAKGPKAKGSKKVSAVKQQAAASVGWFLSTNDKWVAKYFDPSDLHSRDRELFAG
jgi:hypothetical protein